MIISWYRQKIRDFGFFRATWALWRVAWGRAYVKTCNALLPSRVACPCCGWEGRRFFDYVEMGYTAKNISCPRCDSHARHRAFFLWLRDGYGIEKRSGSALIFAPERALAQVWQAAKRLTVFRIDIEPSRGVDVIGDIMRLPFASDFARLIWCHHVLEQVHDDRMALGELHRVLSVTGDLIISAGESSLPSTREFGFSDKAFSGNRRAYAADFAGIVSAAGFEVEPVNCDFSENDKRRFALNDERFYLCRKI